MEKSSCEWEAKWSSPGQADRAGSQQAGGLGAGEAILPPLKFLPMAKVMGRTQPSLQVVSPLKRKSFM